MRKESVKRLTIRLLALAFLIGAAAWPEESGKFAWKRLDGGRLELSEGGKPVLVYNVDPQLKAGAPENRRRCCYIFPIYTPGGVSMLDDFPPDHWHHRGLFWAWPVVERAGKTYDLWMTMSVKDETASAPVLSGGATGRLEAHNVWRIDGRDVVRERMELTAHPTSGTSRDLAVDLIWEAIDAPVTIKGSRETGKSYGGFSARFAAREDTVLRADGDVLEKDEDVTPHRWAELEGVYGGKKAVLRITPGANDPGAPYQWCLRKYGFVGVSFPGRTETADGYTIEPGKPLHLTFRVQVSDAK